MAMLLKLSGRLRIRVNYARSAVASMLPAQVLGNPIPSVQLGGQQFQSEHFV